MAETRKRSLPPRMRCQRAATPLKKRGATRWRRAFWLYVVTSGRYKEGEGFQQDNRPQMESFMLSHQAETQLNDSFRSPRNGILTQSVRSRLTSTGRLPGGPLPSGPSRKAILPYPTCFFAKYKLLVAVPFGL